MKKNLKLIFFSLVLISCAGKDIENVKIKGTVFNKQTDMPIKNSNITIEVECSKYDNSPDESYNDYEIKTVKIDADGNYSVSFNKGALVIFDVAVNGYSRYIYKLDISKSENTHDIYLIPLH